MKAAPTPALLKLLHEEGCGCDCSSMTELMISERCGITGENIMFSSMIPRRRNSRWRTGWAPSSTWTI